MRSKHGVRKFHKRLSRNSSQAQRESESQDAQQPAPQPSAAFAPSEHLSGPPSPDTHAVQLRRLSSTSPTRAIQAARQLQRDYGNRYTEQIAELARQGDDAPMAEIQLPANSGGTALPEAVQQKMENAFGADFSDVRVHEGPEAGAIRAIAYTQGSHIHFQPGQYDPASQAGQELLGHELAHVVQQRAGRVSPGTDGPINDDPALEGEAEVLGNRVARGEAAQASGAVSGNPTSSNAPVQRLGSIAEEIAAGGENISQLDPGFDVAKTKETEIALERRIQQILRGPGREKERASYYVKYWGLEQQRSRARLDKDPYNKDLGREYQIAFLNFWYWADERDKYPGEQQVFDDDARAREFGPPPKIELSVLQENLQK